MSDWKDDLILLAFGASLIALVVFLGGCTATTLEQREAVAQAIEGTYVDGIGCTRMRVASGKAAVAAANENKAKQVQVTR